LLMALAVSELVLFGLVGLPRLSWWAVRGLMWRIRTKLLVSYLFIAVVPLVLLTIFFLLVGFLGLSLAASYMVSSQMERTAQDLRTLAQATLASLRPDDPRLRRADGDADISPEAERPIEAKLRRRTGIQILSAVKRHLCGTGKKDFMGHLIRYKLAERLRRLSPRSLDMSDVFVKGMAIVGG